MKLIFTFGFMICSLIAQGQSLIGLYTSQCDKGKIEFLKEDGIKFELYQPDGLGGTIICGNGKYKYQGKKLTIFVNGHDKSLESAITVIKDSVINSGFVLKGQVITSNGDLIPGANFRFKIGKKYYGFSSDKDGNFFYKFDSKPDSRIEICLIGYASTFIDYTDKSAIEVNIILKESQNRFIDGHNLIANINIDTKNYKFHSSGIRLK